MARRSPCMRVTSANVFTIAPDASVHTAVEMMLTHRIGCLPVVEHGKLVGLVSENLLHGRYLAGVLGISEQKDCLPELPQ